MSFNEIIFDPSKFKFAGIVREENPTIKYIFILSIYCVTLTSLCITRTVYFILITAWCYNVSFEISKMGDKNNALRWHVIWFCFCHIFADVQCPYSIIYVFFSQSHFENYWISLLKTHFHLIFVQWILIFLALSLSQKGNSVWRTEEEIENLITLGTKEKEELYNDRSRDRISYPATIEMFCLFQFDRQAERKNVAAGHWIFNIKKKKKKLNSEKQTEAKDWWLLSFLHFIKLFFSEYLKIRYWQLNWTNAWKQFL